jgi:hypothetical protein
MIYRLIDGMMKSDNRNSNLKDHPTTTYSEP